MRSVNAFPLERLTKWLLYMNKRFGTVSHRVASRRGDGKADGGRCTLGRDRADPAEEAATQTQFRTETALQSSGVNRDPLRAAVGHSLGVLAPRDGLRFGHDLLATAEILAAPRRVGPVASDTASETARRGTAGLLTRHCRQLFDSRRGRGKKTGPNPTDRRRAGSKHHLLTDAQGVPLTAILTPANTNDITQLLPLVEGVPPVGGKVGHPQRKPKLVQGDRAYDSNAHRRALADQRIRTQLARRYTKHGSGLGVTRWVVERTISWLHQFRRLRVRFERRADIHEAFLKLGCCLICWRFLRAA